MILTICSRGNIYFSNYNEAFKLYYKMNKIGILGLIGKADSMFSSLKQNEDIEIIGIYDPDFARAKKIAENNNLPFHTNPFGVIAQSDLIIIPKTDENSFNLMVESVLNSKHVIICNPVLLTVHEVDVITKLAREASVSVVPFLPYRFNNCLINTKSYVFNPGHIEISYTSMPEFKQKNLISEVLINGIDLVLNLVKGNVKKVYANAVRVIGAAPQLIIVRLDFDNGCTANLSFNFISNHDSFNVVVYQPRQIVELDLARFSSIVKSYKKDNILECETIKPSGHHNENPLNVTIGYLSVFEAFDTPVNVMECLRNSLQVLRKVEDKLFQLTR
jgi:predicted dehydrogenase